MSIHPDIDECNDETDGCSHICKNTDGSCTYGCNSDYNIGC